VLREGGVLMSGFKNPVRYLFDNERTNRDRLEVRHAIPYSDMTDLAPTDRQALVDGMESLEFGHTLEDQIGGQLEAGFVLTGFYEDRHSRDVDDPLSRYLATFIATRAAKPPLSA
jgi:hypothetical protein